MRYCHFYCGGEAGEDGTSGIDKKILEERIKNMLMA